MDNSESKTKYLKDRLHYSDLYDRHTVEECRRIEKHFAEPGKSLPEDSPLDKEESIRAESMAKNLYLYIAKGERCIHKDETIREWMDRDKKKDDLFENAQAPEDIRCLTCRNRMKATSKDFWSSIEKEDGVLFMYECPNKCFPRRAFFSDGEEWRVKPNLCLHCSTPLETKTGDDGKKLITTNTCPKCGYQEKDEYEWQHKKDKEDDFDPDFAKDRDRFCLTDEQSKEYKDSKWRMENMGRIAKELEEKEKIRAEKLKANPKGFHLEGHGYRCFICGNSIYKEGDNWYDEYGIKCLVCQKAIDDGEIPASLARDKDGWYSEFDLESAFNLKTPTLRKWAREGILKARTVSYYGQGIHAQLFLIEDNKDFLPPKDLLKSHSVKTREKDGKDYTHMEKWYRFVDPFEHLKGYKIMNYMRVVPPEEMKAREEARKKKDEERRARREQRKTNRPKRKEKSIPPSEEDKEGQISR